MKFTKCSTTPPEILGNDVWSAIKEGAPFVHVEGLPFNVMEPEDSERYIKTLASAIGHTTLTAGVSDSEIWRLDRKTSPSSQFIPYHTDNPFLTVPEKVVSFWNGKSSSKGGANLILSVDELFEWAGQNLSYRDILQEIEETPVTFCHGLVSATGVMLESAAGTARFDMKYIDESTRHVGALLRTILNDPQIPSQTVKLSEGDVLFFDNEKTLHARSEYSDPDRVSLRVRMAR